MSRPPPIQGTRYSLSRAAPSAEGELTKHLTRLPRAVEPGLFCLQHEDRLLMWVASTFQNEPCLYDCVYVYVVSCAGGPPLSSCFGFSVVYCGGGQVPWKRLGLLLE